MQNNTTKIANDEEISSTHLSGNITSNYKSINNILHLLQFHDLSQIKSQSKLRIKIGLLTLLNKYLQVKLFSLQELLSVLDSLLLWNLNQAPTLISKWDATLGVNNANAKIRSIIISILSSICNSLNHLQLSSIEDKDKVKEKIKNIVSAIATFVEDPHHLVRATALEEMFLIHLFGINLDEKKEKLRIMEIVDKEMYKKITELAIHDKYESVRIQSLKLIWVISSMPNTQIFGYEQIVDEGFKRMSSGVVDGSINVRYLASTLLGSFHNVSSQCVLQTFSKEILAGQYKGALSLSRSKQTAEHYSSNSNNPSIVDNQTYIDTRSEIDQVDFIIVTEEDSNILDVEKSSTAAVGIFISALEDEFFLVRFAALDSICELSLLQSSTASSVSSSRKNQGNFLFAARAVDFLVDMFNDEIDAVRINAINSLRKLTIIMSKNGLSKGLVSIKEEQLDVILSSLQDNNRIVRLAILNLLKEIPLQNITCLLATIHALLTNMTRRYNRFSFSNVDSNYSSLGNTNISNIISNNWNSGDFMKETNENNDSTIFNTEIEYTFRSLQYIGREHGTFVEYIIEELLEIDPRFMSQERHLDDLLYIGVVIVISNASIQNQNIFPIIPKYVLKHLRYFVQKYPSFFPPVSIFERFTDLQTTNQLQVLPYASSPSLNMNSSEDLQSHPSIDLFFSETKKKIEYSLLQFSDFNNKNSRSFLSISIAHLNIANRNLRRIVEVNGKHHTNAYFYLLYISCISNFIMLLQTNQSSNIKHKVSLDQLFIQKSKKSIIGGDIEEIITDAREDTVESRIHKLIESTYKMEYLFIGKHWKTSISLISLRLFAHLLSFLNTKHSSSFGNGSFYLASQFQLLSQRYQQLSFFVTSHENELETNVLDNSKRLLDFTSSILSFYSLNGGNQEFRQTNLPDISNLKFIPYLSDVNNVIKEKSCIFHSPISNPDKPIYFSEVSSTSRSSSAIDLEIEASLFHIYDISKLGILVTFVGENQQNVTTSQLIHLPSSSFHLVKPFLYSFQFPLHLLIEDLLQIQSILDNIVSGYIDICFVEIFPLECKEFDGRALNIDNCSPGSRSSRTVAYNLSQSSSRPDWIGLLPLLHSVKVFIKKRV